MSSYDPNCHICNPTPENISRYQCEYIDARRRSGGLRVGAYSGAVKGSIMGAAVGGPIGGLLGLVLGGIWGGKSGYENPNGAVLGLLNLGADCFHKGSS